MAQGKTKDSTINDVQFVTESFLIEKKVHTHTLCMIVDILEILNTALDFRK